MKILWITVIVLISLGAFVYFKPYIEQVMQLYGTAQQALEQAREFGSQFTGGGGE
jgi:hypothetical protein